MSGIRSGGSTSPVGRLAPSPSLRHGSTAGMLTAGAKRAAAVPLETRPAPAATRGAADGHVRGAAAEGAPLIVLPEKGNVLGTPEHLRAGAEPLDGPAVTWMRDTAAELGLDLVGSVAIAEPDEDKLRNVCV